MDLNEDELVTISGKPATTLASFRLPISSYLQIVRYCKKNGITLSKATVQLWQEKLEQENGRIDNGRTQTEIT